MSGYTPTRDARLGMLLSHKHNDIWTILDAINSPLMPQGNWNANTNTPDITGATTTGYFWIVSVAGATDLGGITDWQINDWAVKTATGWAKIDNTETAKVRADSADLVPDYLDGKVQDSFVNDAVTHKLKLSGDSAAPGNNKVYGTDGGGTRGWIDIPVPSGLAVTIGVTGSGADYECDGTADDVQFNAAIVAMAAGDTLKVLPGTYVLADAVAVNKSIVIEGVDRSLSGIVVGGNFNGLILTASGVIIKYLRLSHSAGQTVATPLISISTGANATVIASCALAGTHNIVIADNNYYSSITECMFEYVASPLGVCYGIYLNGNVGASHLTVHRNVIRIAHYGFSCPFSNSNLTTSLITENIFESPYYPIQIVCPHTALTISDNYIKTSGSYVVSIADITHASSYCAGIKITDNIIVGHAGTTLGVQVKAATDVLIGGNVFQAPASAFDYITLGDGTAGAGVIRATITGNVASGSTSGGVIESGASDYTVFEANNNMGTVTLTGANSVNRDLIVSQAVRTDQTTPQTVGATGARLTKLWSSDVEATALTCGGYNALRMVALGAAPTPTTSARKGDYGYYDGYLYVWADTAVVVRNAVETTW